MPSGLVLTILNAEEYQYDERDDVAFAKTSASILDRLEDDDTILNPKDSNENLRDRITDSQFENFMNRLDTLIQHAETALEIESQKEAAEKHWVRVLGDRFPVYDDDKDKTKNKKHSPASQGLIGVGTSSA